MQQIQASKRAFAAILANGSVVTWGDGNSGGDSVSEQAELKEVRCQGWICKVAFTWGVGRRTLNDSQYCGEEGHEEGRHKIQHRDSILGPTLGA